ncbi:potassium voltage-gated channel subfamily KQT member 1-like [Grus japonensis]|uniref:Potassium voltage-gated channel subfamily KQT member 1-like n=1 Tax=Grus japonensis TaxID=30415 RepID=A0ABC9VWX1_GRUJA
MFFKILIFFGLIYYTKLHCIQASLEAIPVAYMMLATVLPLEQTRAVHTPQPVPLADAKVMQMDQKLDDILNMLQAQFGDQPQAQMSGSATPPVRQPQTTSDSPPVNRKI